MILRSFVFQALTAGLAASYTSDKHDSMDPVVDSSASKFVDQLVAKLFSQASPLQHIDLDGTTLGKTGHLALPQQGSRLLAPSAIQSPAPLHMPSHRMSLQRPLQHPGVQPIRLARLGSPQAGSVVDVLRPSAGASNRKRFPHITKAATTETEDAPTETYKFEAETGRIMDIIINSIYSDRDVFLRELISNSADAIEKKRFMAIQFNKMISDDLTIKVRCDKANKIVYVEDNGIGMTKSDLIENLGRIARSGTKAFTEAMQKDSANLIGMFGVGFYSSFLIAEQVTVTTKAYNQTGEQIFQWSSVPGDFGNYKVREVAKFPGADQGLTSLEFASSGTQIALKVKNDAEEYLDPTKLSNLLKKFSEFISFPINLWNEKMETIQVPDGNKTNEDGSQKMKSQPKQVWQWEQMNKQRPLWLRPPSNVSQNEYTEFYKTTFRAFDDPTAQLHFSAEGQIEFRAMMFFPSFVPFELTQNMFAESGRAIRLYVKRVFINDKFEDIVPRWLTFLRGVVDSDDLPLNVGREILQKSRTLTVIRKNIVRKVLDWMKNAEKNEPEKFKKVWDNYGRYFKVGLIEDPEYKEQLLKIVRFFSSTQGDETTSLNGYCSRMKENQTSIYYVTGEGRKNAQMAPAMETMNAKGYEVIYLTDPLDEMTVQNNPTFDGKKFVDINKGDLDLDDDAAKAKDNTTQTEYAPLMKWMQDTLGTEKIKAVKLSTRLTDFPAVLVQPQYGMSPTMQRYMRAQATARGEDDKLQNLEMNQATLEINPEQPIIQKLKETWMATPNSPDCTEMTNFVYEIAAITGGYTLNDPGDFAKRVTGLVTKGVTGEAAMQKKPKAKAKASPSPAPKPAEKKAPETVDAEVIPPDL